LQAYIRVKIAWEKRRKNAPDRKKFEIDNPRPVYFNTDQERLKAQTPAQRRARLLAKRQRIKRWKSQRMRRGAPGGWNSFVASIGHKNASPQMLLRNAEQWLDGVRVPKPIHLWLVKQGMPHTCGQSKRQLFQTHTSPFIAVVAGGGAASDKYIKGREHSRNPDYDAYLDACNLDKQRPLSFEDWKDCFRYATALPDDFDFISIMGKVMESTGYFWLTVIAVVTAGLWEEPLKRIDGGFAFVVFFDTLLASLKGARFLSLIYMTVMHTLLLQLDITYAIWIHTIHNSCILLLQAATNDLEEARALSFLGNLFGMYRKLTERKESQEEEQQGGGGAASCSVTHCDSQETNDVIEIGANCVTEYVLNNFAAPGALAELPEEEQTFWGEICRALKNKVAHVIQAQYITYEGSDYIEFVTSGIQLGHMARLVMCGGVITTVQAKCDPRKIRQDMRGLAQKSMCKESKATYEFPARITRQHYAKYAGAFGCTTQTYEGCFNRAALLTNTQVEHINSTFDDRFARHLRDNQAPTINISVLDGSSQVTAAFKAALSAINTTKETLNESARVSITSLLQQLMFLTSPLLSQIRPYESLVGATSFKPFDIQSVGPGIQLPLTTEDSQPDTGSQEKTSQRSTTLPYTGSAAQCLQQAGGGASGAPNSGSIVCTALTTTSLDASKDLTQKSGSETSTEQSKRNENCDNLPVPRSKSGKKPTDEKPSAKQKDMINQNTSGLSMHMPRNLSLFSVLLPRLSMRQHFPFLSSSNILAFVNAAICLIIAWVTNAWLKLTLLPWRVITAAFSLVLRFIGTDTLLETSESMKIATHCFAFLCVVATPLILVILWRVSTKPSCPERRGQVRRMEF
jgi:hypothetical protein